MFNYFRRKKRVYLDHAAATPIRNEVLRAMMPYLTDMYGNASAIHAEGRAARGAVEAAREEAARTLRVRADDVVFTGGGTESNNLALRGAVEAMKQNGLAYSDIEILSSRMEHPSILRTLDALRSLGCAVMYVPALPSGKIDRSALRTLISSRTRLVSFAYANSETGVVEDIAAIGRMFLKAEREHGSKILFHTDASQAPLWLSCALSPLRVDMMTLDSGKFGGPKGVGMLVRRPRTAVVPVAFGGSQESGFRPGTENTAGIVGAARALTLAQDAHASRSARVRAVRDHGFTRLCAFEGVVRNGDPNDRTANNINISLLGFDTEYAAVVLDTAGFAVSTKSACSGAGGGMSRVVFEMTNDAVRAGSTLRITLGEATRKGDMDLLADTLDIHMKAMRPYAKTSV